MEGARTTLAHLSDPHLGPPALAWPAKRALTWLAWRMRRGAARDAPAVLGALVADLRAQAPAQVVVTGDLTCSGTEHELEAARAWLAGLGPPQRVTAVPGNHDALASDAPPRLRALWSEYLASDPPDARETPAWPGGEARAKPSDAPPGVRVRGPLALVALWSARPTPLGLATGCLGPAQLARLERALVALGERGLFRALLLHHPPAGAVSPRRALRDAAPLRAVLRRAGAELVLHGHLHRTALAWLEGPTGPIPALCVPSAASRRAAPERAARYHLYEIESRCGPGRPRFRVTLRARRFDPRQGRFVAAGDALPLCG